ncbi:MAG: nitroreductase [Micromonosporaceae bacterium]|nr:nitroreductase [Micromonosporaceae bacterium]
MAPPPARAVGLPLHPLLAARRSPFAFDPSIEVTSLELATLLEAARWAPSHRNSQPWRFLVGRREDGAYQRVLAELPADDQRWAARAPLLLVAAHLTRTVTGSPLPHGAYDLGQAVAHLTVQASALGLSVRQVTPVDGGALRSVLELPDRVVPAVVIAVGRLGDPAGLPEDLRAREVAPRVRQPAAALLLG